MATLKHARDARKTDAISLLKGDHEKVSSLLEEFEKATGQRKQSLAEKICNELSVHARIEEEIFYPAARAVLGNDEDLIDEADVEHATLKGLVQRIQSNGASDEHFEALVKVLGEYVKHHVKEEEGEIFPKVRRSGMDLEATGADLARRKAELEKTLA